MCVCVLFHCSFCTQDPTTLNTAIPYSSLPVIPWFWSTHFLSRNEGNRPVESSCCNYRMFWSNTDSFKLSNLYQKHSMVCVLSQVNSPSPSGFDQLLLKGIVVDDVRLSSSSSFPGFYAVNQATTRGTAVPGPDSALTFSFQFCTLGSLPFFALAVGQKPALQHRGKGIVTVVEMFTYVPIPMFCFVWYSAINIPPLTQFHPRWGNDKLPKLVLVW